MDPLTPPPEDIERVVRVLGWRPESFRPAAASRGTTASAARWIVRNGDRTAFIKVGSTELTADWIRHEYRNYQTIRGGFMPRTLGFVDDGTRPVLALEDLSEAVWPPPWSEDGIAAVLEAATAIHAVPPPQHLARWSFDGAADWSDIEARPEPFLSLGLCSAAWLAAALPMLQAAAASAPLTGDDLVHLDIRSDNVCLRGRQAIVIDWNHATVANGDLDIAFWLPSLHAEGGPAPESILSDVPGLAAWVAGFFCARAGQSELREAPHVRPLQLSQARTALPWAARALGLRPPG